METASCGCWECKGVVKRRLEKMNWGPCPSTWRRQRDHKIKLWTTVLCTHTQTHTHTRYLQPSPPNSSSLRVWGGCVILSYSGCSYFKRPLQYIYYCICVHIYSVLHFLQIRHEHTVNSGDSYFTDEVSTIKLKVRENCQTCMSDTPESCNFRTEMLVFCSVAQQPTRWAISAHSAFHVPDPRENAPLTSKIRVPPSFSQTT